MTLPIEPEKLPRDYRKLLRPAFLIVLLSGAVGAIATPISKGAVEPLEHKLEAHLSEVAALKPKMAEFVDLNRADLASINAKLDVLLEDCYRRNGCRKR